MFYGEYLHSIDTKGRVIVPVKFRPDLGEIFIVTKGLDQCLFLYSMNEWKNIEAKLKNLPFTDKDVRSFTRFFFAGAAECEVDKQGRILIPQSLRAYAQLKKDTVFIGVSSRVELWDKEKWDAYTSEEQVAGEKLAEKMAMLGI